ncbi:MAG: putative peptide transport system permease [Actinomycetia bacterium]|nr:putative peptide transport system permease [Actinomycetes bacterium]MDQ1651851.1 peptide/nickel transport system permease protein [Cryptosporangiaceae bacterium]MDQ1655704.1 peptide/nickel transport system permease protein [Cryptosporangiaceae bacterium]
MRAARVAGTLLARLTGVLFLGFALFHLLPGDPVSALTRGRPVTTEDLATIRAGFGLDLPLWKQFTSYVTALAHGDLGTSLAAHRPVADMLAERIGPTLLLTVSATVLSVTVGIATGVAAGWRPRGIGDRVGTGAAIVLWSAPTFWLGMLLMAILGVAAGLFPIAGMRSTESGGGGVLDVAHHLVLPCITLAAVQYAQYHLLIRSAVAAERHAVYVTLARAKGLPDALVRWRHAVPNAMAPTLSLVLTNLGFVVSGAVTVEAVFSWPGLGDLTFEALRGPDPPVLHGTFLLLCGSVVTADAIADVVLRRFDRRGGTT